MASLHPHDTDRILAVLGEAISKLRDESARSHWEGHPLADAALDVANDLALLHGAVSAEASALTREELKVLAADEEPEEANATAEYRHRYGLHREEIAQEVLNGEHDVDHDYWSPDGG